MESLLKKFVLTVCGLIFISQVFANNLVISGTAVAGDDISFNISWDNSWNTNLAPNNWDAVWVFVKYQDCATRQWYHAALSTSSLDHVAGGLLTVDAVPDGMGVYVKRSAVGGGNIASTAVTLKLNIPAGSYNYKVFGVEMVYVPTADFQVGDGAANNTFGNNTITGAIQDAGITGATLGGSSANVPATFPMGVDSFYCMKYEVTMEQYVEFLNTLAYDQQVTRTAVDPISATGTLALYNGTYRNKIKIVTPGFNNTLPAVYGCDYNNNAAYNETDDGQNISCNFLMWGDLSAYLDWAALRPMTEMEFEKVCRGPQARVAGEFPWGTTDYAARASVSAVNLGSANESFAAVANGAVVQSGAPTGLYGPCRVGIFATGSSGRASAGAAYYGAMEMGGNNCEQVICVRSTNNGTTYTGVLGDGALSVTGNANQTLWPGTTGTGTGSRGGDWYNAATRVQLSDRYFTTSPETTRNIYSGGRGVR